MPDHSAKPDAGALAAKLVSWWLPSEKDWYFKHLLPELMRNASVAFDHENEAIDALRELQLDAAHIQQLAASALRRGPADPLAIQHFRMLCERIGKYARAEDPIGARRAYNAFSGAPQAGRFEELWRWASLLHVTRARVEQLRQARGKAAKQRAWEAIKAKDFAALAEVAAEGEVELEQAEAGLRWIAKRVVGEFFPGGDIEKEIALAIFAKSILVRARAGSGKTALLTMHTTMLVKWFGIDPSRILVLAFNRKAAQEIGRRIRGQVGANRPFNARIFHSLARELVQPTETLLFDEGGREAGPQSDLIAEIIRTLWDQANAADLVRFFRRETAEFVAAGRNLSKHDAYIMRRNKTQLTLRGEVVKSVGEKWIADFLFEHQLTYSYEEPHFWKGRIYRPDFKIWASGKEIVLEHWGIDLEGADRTVPAAWDRSWAEYRSEIDVKRSYWTERRRRLVETSIRDMREGREAFERILRMRIEGAGIECVRLSDAEIASRIREKHRQRLQTMLRNFIQ